MKISLVVATLGRSAELAILFRSLETQSFKDFEVVIVDQNGDDRVADLVASSPWPFPIAHLRVPHVRGLSRARNIGSETAKGEILCFPDDDCHYPAAFLEKALNLLERTGAGIVAGRAADEQGHSINGNFEAEAQWIDRQNVFRTQIEWVVFFRRKVFDAIGGYDVDLGTGASSPWQANEGQDIVLRALQSGIRAYYDPALFGHHPELKVSAPDRKLIAKQRGYARGMGFVLGRYRYPFSLVLRSLYRPLGGAAIYACKLNWPRADYYLNMCYGRLEGYIDGRRQSEPAPRFETARHA